MIFYIAIMETVDSAKDAEVLEDHLAYLNKYIDGGKIYAKGPFLDHTGGLIIYKVDSFEEAKEIIENDKSIFISKSRRNVHNTA